MNNMSTLLDGENKKVIHYFKVIKYVISPLYTERFLKFVYNFKYK